MTYHTSLIDVNRWDRVIFESDLDTLVQALSSPGYGDSESMLLFLVLFMSYLYIPTSW